jgi:hypothetical protein
MLELTDHGCNKHILLKLKLMGVEAERVKNIVFNLPREGDFHTYICEYGHTHRISFQFITEKRYPVEGKRFPKSF